MKGIWITISLLALTALWTTVHAEEGSEPDDKTQVAMLHTVDAAFYSTVKGIVSVPDPIMILTPTVAEVSPNPGQQVQVRAAKIQELVKSISAIEDKEVGLSDKKKQEIADAALAAQEKTGVDAVLMIAVARMESDFQGVTQVSASCKAGFQEYGCYADCGMTQHHIRGPAKYVIARCKALARNTKESFLLSATEISSHVRWCRTHATKPWNRPIRQCVLNRYNMGPSYATARGCRKRYNCEAMLKVSPQHEDFAKFEQAAAYCKVQRRKCVLRSSYWERVTCFEYGARKYQRSTRNCRWCTDITKIQRVFYKVLSQEPEKVAAGGTGSNVGATINIGNAVQKGVTDP